MLSNKCSDLPGTLLNRMRRGCQSCAAFGREPRFQYGHHSAGLVAVDPRAHSISAVTAHLVLLLKPIVPGQLKLHADRGYLLLDVRRIDDAELDMVVARVREVLATVPADAVPIPTPSGGDLTRQAMARWLAPKSG